jgi:hypothetical protein
VRNSSTAITAMAAIVLMFSSVARSQTAAPSPPPPRPPQAASSNLPFDLHDLSGIWWGHNARGVNSSLSSTAPPMTPWAQERYNAAKPGLGRSSRAQPLGNDPMMICDPMGFPRIMFWTNYPYEIVQLPNRTLVFFDWFYTYRTIWTDGRQLAADPDPRWYGNSVGTWEGDAFVVRSNGFDDRSWLDADGHPHSEEMRLEERYRRVNHDTIEITMTLTDPRAYITPWVSEKMTLTLADPKTRMREDVCVPSAEQKYKEIIRTPAGSATTVVK